jgi:zinc protease
MLDKRYPGPDTILRRSLDNGITVLAYENFASQTVAIEAVVRAGALQEDANLAGLSSFTAEMLLRGTERYDFDQIFELLESYGASLSFSGGRHLTQISGYCLVEDVDLVLDIMVQALRSPLFQESQVERVRGQFETGLKMRANDTGRMASLAFMETLYGDHPYGRPVHGYFDSVARIQLGDLLDFHDLHYGPQGMIIGIAGAICSETVFTKVCETFDNWDNSRQVVIPAVADATRPEKNIVRSVEMPGKSQVDIIMGLPGPRRSASDYLHVSLMNTILGVFGMMGRIGQNLREEKGLAYYASSHLAGGLGPAPWSASAGTTPRDVARVISGIKYEILRMQEELVPSDELGDCKSFRVGLLPVGLETNMALADTIVDIELYELGLDYLQRYPDLILSISAKEVQAAAKKYLSTEGLVISLAGPFHGVE